MNKKKKSSLYLFVQLWPFVKPYKKALIVAVIALFVNAVVEAWLVSLTKPLLDNGLMQKNYSFLFWTAFAIIGLVALRGLSNYASRYSLSWLSGKVVNQFRQLLFNHLVRSPVSFHDKKSVGELVSVITFNTQGLSAASSEAMIVFVREITYAIGLCAVMFYGSWKLALILLVILPVIFFTVQFIAKKFRDTIKSMQKGMGTITSIADEMLKGHKEVLIYNAQQHEKNNFNLISEVFRKGMLKIAAVSGLSTPIVQLIASLGLATVLFIVSHHSMEISPGSFTVVFTAMIALMRPIRELTRVHIQLEMGSVACESLFGLLATPLEEDKGTIDILRAKGTIEFKNVIYTYPTRTEPALNKISLTINAGETVALVGRSGSGKSTIVSLLPRFYDVSQGEILLDAINIKEYTLKSLRNQIGYVSQRVHLFNSTIADNIAYGEKNKYTLDQISEAARLANAMEFIEKLENGLHTQVGDNGVLLSGGQKQRIAIARVLLRDTPILIFDEATSALDNESERLVQDAIEKLQKNRTSIIIAHRLSTIENADRIIVLDEGKVVEEGNHQSLLAKNGLYAHMHHIQFENE